MKMQFEPEDFKGSGQLLIRNSSSPGSTDHEFATSVSYKVGYMPSLEGNVSLLISLSDGMAVPFGSKEALCAHLNSDIIGYRPMTDGEIDKTIVRQGSRFK